MDVTGAGTAIMIAIAALLWFLYFVPTWMARREYLDTERTATRLQQTLRVMAETAEVPEQLRVEVTARDAARHERILRAQQRAEERTADALALSAAATARAATPAAPRTAAAVSWTRDDAPATAAGAARLRRRRARRLASILLIGATVAIAVQLWLVATTGAVPGSWVVLGAGAAVGIVGVTVRRRADVRASAAPAAVAPRAATSTTEIAAPATAPRAPGWTPVPVPKPLYLSRPVVQPVRPALDLEAQLRDAALESERALRAAQAAPEVVPIRPAPVAPSPSRWAAMGRFDAPDAATPDLDEVLRRRRSAG